MVADGEVLYIKYLCYHRTVPDAEGADVHVLNSSDVTRHAERLLRREIPIARPDVLVNPLQDKGYQVGFTFDDGSASDIENACALRDLNAGAIFFVPTSVIGSTGYLSGAQLRAIRSMGMVIGSHSHHHRPLPGRTVAEIRSQLKLSKDFLEDLLGEPIQHLAPPGGLFDSMVSGLAEEAGYRYLFSTKWGVNKVASDRKFFVLRRNSINRERGFKLFDRITEPVHTNYRDDMQYACKQIAKQILPRTLFSSLKAKYFG